jgi:hypothetical protein
MNLANYVEQVNPDFKGNPFIEALPPRLSKDSFEERFSLTRPSPTQCRSRSAVDRLDLLEMITSFFVYMPWHFNLYNTIYSMTKRCYVSRNPAEQEYWLLVKEKRKVLRDAYKHDLPVPRGRIGAALIGCSGQGKSEVLKRIVALFPRVIVHTKYRGEKMACLQLFSLFIEADRNTSVKGICDQIFEQADRLLGTRYSDIYRRETEPGKVAGVVTVCHLHGVGIIVLDEIQELSLKKSGGENGIVSFLLHLANRAGPSVLFVGTPDAPLLRNEAMRYIRRSSGIPEVLPLAKESDDWKDFLDELWRYQYTKNITEITDEIADTLHALSRGIPELTIEIYKRAQAVLIQHEGPKNPELLTPQLLEEVALSYLAREIEAAKRWDVPYGGGRPADAPSIPRGRLSLRTRSKSAKGKDSEPVAGATENKSVRTIDGKAAMSLIEIASMGAADSQVWLENLRSAGIIKDPMEFLEANQ